MMMKFKQGADFIIEIRRDPVVDLTDLQIVSRLKGRDGYINLDIRRVDNAQGIFQVFAPAAATKLWRPGIYSWDIKYIGDQSVTVWPLSSNMLLEIIESPTHADP